MMEEKNSATHSDGCVCDSGKMLAHKRKHYLLKLAVGCIFLFMAFWIGVQMGEIKGALGITPEYRTMQYRRVNTMQGNMMQAPVYGSGMQY